MRLVRLHRLPVVLHVEALLHASRAHERAVAPRQHSVHDAPAGGPPAEPPPEMPHHRAVEALRACHIYQGGYTNASKAECPPRLRVATL